MEEQLFKIDTRCPHCFRSRMRRDDGGLRPHKRLTFKYNKPGQGATWKECVGYERANAAKNADGGTAQ